MSVAAMAVSEEMKSRTLSMRAVMLRLAGLVGLIVALGIWQVLAAILHTAVFPTFTTTVSTAVTMIRGSELKADILPSIGRALAGFAIACVVGITLGLFLGYIRWLGRYCVAVVDFTRSIPLPLLTPLAILLFGEGSRMVIIIVAAAVVWPVLINSWDGARRVEPLYLDAGRACGLRGPSIFAHVLFPAALPPIFAGLRLALSNSLLVLIVAEYLGSNSGIGYLMNQAALNFQISDVYAGALILIVLGWLFDTVFLLIEHRLLGWLHLRARGVHV